MVEKRSVIVQVEVRSGSFDYALRASLRMTPQWVVKSYREGARPIAKSASAELRSMTGFCLTCDETCCSVEAKTCVSGACALVVVRDLSR